MAKTSQRVREVADQHIRQFFLDAIEAALTNQGLEARRGTVRYVVDLLAHYARSRNFYEQTDAGFGLEPLAMYYARAVSGATRLERVRALRRLGDVALFVAGVFSGSLNRKLVDVDYYIAMGGGAYAQLSRSYEPSEVKSPEVFEELSRKFRNFVDVLDEVSERSPGRRNSDLLRTYEVWVRTGSTRAARRLQRHGILPADGSVSRRHH